jgi:hypothetical protein
MSQTWNGSALRTRYAQKYGYSDTTSLARMLEWMNEICINMHSGFKWPHTKMKLKKEIASGSQEIDLSPQIPSAPTIALLAGGSLTTGVAYLKTTFVLFDESGKEFNSIESEPSAVSNSVTLASTDLSLTVTGIDTYDGSTSVKPTTIHRRLYLKIGDADYILAKTIEDNTTTTTTITSNSGSTIEPPIESMVDFMADEDPVIELSGMTVYPTTLENIKRNDPNLSSTGTPQYYARISTNKIFVWPRPSTALTLSYWVFKKPSRIFAETERVLQMPEKFKTTLDAGITWKFYEYKDSDGQETKLSNSDALKSKDRGEISTLGGQALRVKVVC